MSLDSEWAGGVGGRNSIPARLAVNFDGPTWIRTADRFTADSSNSVVVGGLKVSIVIGIFHGKIEAVKDIGIDGNNGVHRSFVVGTR